MSAGSKPPSLGGGSSWNRPLQDVEPGSGGPPKTCLLLNLPIEVQKHIVENISKKHLHSLQRVSKHFRDLASARIYGKLRFSLTAPPASCHLSKQEFRLSYFLQTVALSDYDYAQHIKMFSVNLTERISADMNRHIVAKYQCEEEAGRFLDTLMQVMLRKATKLEWFRWMVPVELSYAIYKTLSSKVTLRHFYVNLETLFSPSWPSGSLTESPHSSVPPPPPPPGIGVSSGIPIQQSASQFTNPFIPGTMNQHYLNPLDASPLKSVTPPPFMYREVGATFSHFQGLVTLEAIGMVSHQHVPELRACLKSSSFTLKNLCLSMSRYMAGIARKPGQPSAWHHEPLITNIIDNDDNLTEPLTPPTEPAGASADLDIGFDPGEEKLLQDGMLAKIFGLDPTVPRDKAMDRHLKSSASQFNTAEVDLGDVVQDLVDMAKKAVDDARSRGSLVYFDIKHLIHSPLFGVLMEKTVEKHKAMARLSKKKVPKGESKLGKKGSKLNGQPAPTKVSQKPSNISNPHAMYGFDKGTHTLGGSASKAGPSSLSKAPSGMGSGFGLSPTDFPSLFASNDPGDVDQVLFKNPHNKKYYNMAGSQAKFHSPSNSQTWAGLPPNAPKVGGPGLFGPGPSSGASKHTSSKPSLLPAFYPHPPMPTVFHGSHDEWISNEAYFATDKAKYGSGYTHKKKNKPIGKKKGIKPMPAYDYSVESTDTYDSESTEAEPAIPYFPAAEQSGSEAGDDIDMEHPDGSDDGAELFSSSSEPEPTQTYAAHAPVVGAAGVLAAAADSTTSPANASSDLESLAVSASKGRDEQVVLDLQTDGKSGSRVSPAPSPSKRKAKLSREEKAKETMKEYLLMKHGFSLESLIIYLIPLKPSVLARAVDLTCLTTLGLLSVGPQGAFWMLMSSHLEAGSTFKLKTIHTDDVSLAFLNFVSSISGLENLFMLTRNKKAFDCTTSKVPASMDDIRTLALRTHASTLQRLMISNFMNEEWRLDVKCIRLLAAKAKKLKELSCCTTMKTWNFPGFESLVALHLVRIAGGQYAQPHEFRDSLLDALHFSPKSKLKYFLQGTTMFVVSRRSPVTYGHPKGFPLTKTTKSKGKGPANLWDTAQSEDNKDEPKEGAAGATKDKGKGKGKAPATDPLANPIDLSSILEGLSGYLDGAGAKGGLKDFEKDGLNDGIGDGDGSGGGEGEHWSDIESEERTITMSQRTVSNDPDYHPRILIFEKETMFGRF